MSEQMYALSLSLVATTVILLFGMRFFATARQARARLVNDDAYRELAAKSAAAQSETAAALASIGATLAELKARVMSLENILKEVG